jgi:hypothetical protein
VVIWLLVGLLFTVSVLSDGIEQSNLLAIDVRIYVPALTGNTDNTHKSVKNSKNMQFFFAKAYFIQSQRKRGTIKFMAAHKFSP